MAVQYTYEDFEQAAKNAGLLGQFSNADLQTAKSDPNFGMSILGLKQNWANAATDEERQQINNQANQLRSSYGNYTGGADGSQYISTGLLPNKIDDTLEKVESYAPFSYDVPAPTYNNQYAAQQQALLNEILNREAFDWSKENDPLWPVYKKEYLREGDRATQNALGAAAAASGGIPSSYAVNAATQAGDYYAAKLNDVLPTLRAQAYDEFLNEYNRQLSALSALNAQEQLDYAKYQDQLAQYNTDRNFAYQDYQTQYDMLQTYLKNLQGQETTEYNRAWDEEARAYEREQNQQAALQAQVDAILGAGGSPGADLLSGSGYTDEYVRALEAEYQRQATEKQQAALQAQVDAILGAGGSPSAELVGGSGYTNEYVQALENYYKQQAAKAVVGSSGSSSGSSGSGGSNGGSSNTGDVYSKLLASGATDYGTAYAMLLSLGYSSTEAKELASYFEEIYYPGQNQQTPTGGNENTPAIAPSTSGMNDAYFAATMRSITGALASGKPDSAQEAINQIWDKLSDAQKASVTNLIASYGGTMK